jgi:hypothetical protein
VIDRDRIECLLKLNKDGLPALSANEIAELLRVYLAWLDAPEGRASHAFGKAARVTVQGTGIVGKRVRLVEVK